MQNNILTNKIIHSSIRGRLGLIYQYGRRFGVLFAYVVVSYLGYDILGMIFVAIIAIFYCSFLFMPSTPQYLFHKNMEKVNFRKRTQIPD